MLSGMCLWECRSRLDRVHLPERIDGCGAFPIHAGSIFVSRPHSIFMQLLSRRCHSFCLYRVVGRTYRLQPQLRGGRLPVQRPGRQRRAHGPLGPAACPRRRHGKKTGRRTCHVLLEHRHGHKLVPFDDYGELWLLDGEAQIRRRVWPVPGGDWCTSGPLARRAAAGTWGDCMHACFKRLDNKLMSTLTCSFHCTSDPFYAVDVLLPSVALTPTAVGRRLGQKAGGPPVRR